MVKDKLMNYLYWSVIAFLGYLILLLSQELHISREFVSGPKRICIADIWQKKIVFDGEIYTKVIWTEEMTPMLCGYEEPEPVTVKKEEKTFSEQVEAIREKYK